MVEEAVKAITEMGKTDFEIDLKLLFKESFVEVLSKYIENFKFNGIILSAGEDHIFFIPLKEDKYLVSYTKDELYRKFMEAIKEYFEGGEN